LYDRTQQTDANLIPLKRNEVVTIVPIRIVAKKHQVVAYLYGGLPEPLLSLPTVPAV
jgi:hypothetical protein